MSVTRRSFLKGLAAGGAAISAPAALAATLGQEQGKGAQARPADAPNLLIVFPDEFRAQALQFMGQDPSLTPNLNTFAKQSRVMRQAVSNYPLCTPFRGMLMTGQYPIRNGITGNAHDFGGKVGIELSRYAQCWSDVLKKLDYSTGYIGKWHLDAPQAPFIESYNNPMEGRYWNDWTAPDRRHGFDFWYSYGTYDLHMRPMYWGNNTPRESPMYVDQWSAEHEADMAIKFLRNEKGSFRAADKPFALVVSMNPPHSPYDQVPQKYLDRFPGKSSRDLNTRPNVDWQANYQEGYGPQYFKEYMAMVNGVDEQFGRILAELDKQGLAENTLVVFFSDHGCCLGANGQPTKNVPYEEAMRIPMMFRLPGKIAPGSDDALMSAPDIYPTILGLMGLEQWIPGTVEGSNLAARITHGKGETASSQLYLFVPYGEPSFGRRGVRTASHTLVIDRQDGQPLKYTLYDNVNDPYQMKNIASGNDALIKKITDEELIPWLEKTGDSWRPVEFTTATTNKLNKKVAECAKAS
ncbi:MULTISPECIES: sulfatase family protein [Edwardsiella]|uniref:Choline-sulfatase n=2 Tax=Edwardsiella anguillarum TaxID=1821960 RepID=A0A076LLN5_9GAMM|nr:MULTISPECIES: sulfatase [Edwardsiella]AKM46911.1 exported sulfatase [Edwardsiella sp. EA181011]GAJ68186.1 choline-sulfatase [Edwardsiella piscicida]AIJ07603.1 Choline-sulfatase [Edwardsiella anguillarum ET080813]AKR78790.1 sulfatase [Edwardsiella sp. LADL05-105]KAB0591479.1 sulfatase [Edwardsiella anguillarum]